MLFSDIMVSQTIIKKPKMILTVLIKKEMALHNVITLNKSALNKHKNHYYYKIFLEKFSYQLVKK